MVEPQRSNKANPEQAELGGSNKAEQRENKNLLACASVKKPGAFEIYPSSISSFASAANLGSSPQVCEQSRTRRNKLNQEN